MSALNEHRGASKRAFSFYSFLLYFSWFATDSRKLGALSLEIRELPY